MKSTLIKPLLYSMFAGVLLFSCSRSEDDDLIQQKDTFEIDSEIVIDWYELYLELERYTPGYRPPVSARTLGYIGIAGYEALLPSVENEYISILSQMSDVRLPELAPDAIYEWEVVLNAMYERLFTLFFENAPADLQYDITVLAGNIRSEFEGELHPYNFQESEKYGREVADLVFQWSSTDVLGHKAEDRNIDPGYSPPSGPGLWQPTYPDFLEALTPYWGDVRTFVASDDVKAPNPVPYSESPQSQLYAQALETQIIVNEIRAGERYEDRWIADFWSDDCPILTFTPVGRWVAIANQASESVSLSLKDAVILYAQLGMALSDAGVRCWGEKYRFNYIRPIDYIRNVLNDDNWNTVMCPDGSGRFFTPNFPTYPSGHATFAGAASKILNATFGSHFRFVDRCHENRTEFLGQPRSFVGFDDMAQECSYSRVPLGVHFRMDSEGGLELGNKIGRAVLLDLKWNK